jgi:leukocyte elastase inhibitor
MCLPQDREATVARKRERLLGVLCALGIATAAPAAPDDPAGAALVAAYNRTGQQLFRAFAEKPGNIVLSPYSIGTAMTMALAGAGEGTEPEMAKVLGLDLSRAQINDANAAVLKSLNSAPSDAFQLNIANAVMLTKTGSPISDSYVALLQDKYAAEVFRGASLATVNGWVRDKTNGKIESILDRLDSQTALILLDAIYFKAQWLMVFNAVATHDAMFHLLAGQATVPTMHMRASFPLAERPGYRAIRMPYQSARMGMVVVLPDDNLADVTQRLDDAEMRSLLMALRQSSRLVDLSLPRFHASFEANLVDPFTAMGMKSPFSTQTADFSSMTGRPPSEVPLAIDQIMHRAVIDVAEQGTEAAAATAVTAVGSAIGPQSPETFTVDRPFLFAIVDEESGAILFEGRIVDPR